MFGHLPNSPENIPTALGMMHYTSPPVYQHGESTRRSERITAYQELARQRIHKAAEVVVAKEAHLKSPDHLEIGQLVDIQIRQRDGKWEIAGKVLREHTH